MLEQQIEQDLKAALLAGDKDKVTVLRGIKAALLNVKVAEGKRDSGLSDEEVLTVLSKQSKQRQESADLYRQGGGESRALQEEAEKEIIDAYLPKQLDEAEIVKMIEEAIQQIGATGIQAMGQVIGQVKGKAGPAADGAVIARLTKERLQ
jgi:uncharacterized protein YqeY